MLVIENLKSNIGKTEILKGVNLKVNSGEIHAIMGTNGCGKSTLLHTIMGNQIYKLTNGEVYLGGEKITKLEPNYRANLGMFLSFQSPYEFFETSTINILTLIWNTKAKKKGNTDDFLRENKQLLNNLKISDEMLSRDFNVGFSGGERKRLEVLQLLLLQPSLVLLDEIDTGLDIDSIISIGNTLKKYQKKNKATFIVVTHLTSFLDYLVPKKVHIMHDGIIVKTGTKSLATKISKVGYSFILN